MKKLPVALVTAVMLIALSSGIASAKDQVSHVEAQPFPSITLNLSGGVYYNLSYMGLHLETPNGSYVTSFNQGKWNFTTANNGTYKYTSVVEFHPDNSNKASVALAGLIEKGSSSGTNGNSNNSSNGNTSQNSTKNQNKTGPTKVIPPLKISAYVVISMKALNNSLSNLSVANSSFNSENYSFPQYSILEISIQVTFENPVRGPGNLEMIQLIKSSNDSSNGYGYYFGDIVHGQSKNLQGKSQGIRIPARYNNSSNGTVNAFYWWNNVFDLNGVQQNLSSTVAPENSGVYIMFNFSFNNSTSLKSVYQDPYIGVSGVSIFENPIVKKVVGTIVNYVVINAEYFATGLTSAIVLIGGTTYSIYRRHRF